MNDAVEMLKSGVLHLLPPSKDLPVTKIMDSLMESKSHSDTDDFLYFDPKNPKKSDGLHIPKSRLTFQHAVVFMLGGGNYSEYLNLKQYAQRTQKSIIYGTTELVNSHQFLTQLSELAEKS
jgi:hypothetical protein